MDKQWKMVPVERSYDMRVKALMAFNTAQREGKDRDDALDAAFQAMLDAAPQPPSASDDDDECTHEFVMFQSACVRCGQPYEETPSASDERERSDLLRELGKASVCACTCKAGTPDPAKHAYACRYRAIALARAALAPSPGVDAAEQKPCAYRRWDDINSRWHFTLWPEEEQQFEWSPVYAASSPAASADEWMAEAERLVDAYGSAEHEMGRGYGDADDERAALLAHLKALP